MHAPELNNTPVMRPLATRLLTLLLVPCFLLLLLTACSGKNELILATTTSTQDSGLLDVLVPMFEDEYGYSVKTIAVGSGAALKLGEEGEADVILAHSPKAEEEFMAAGNGESRAIVMHNDFVLVGPADDPAGVADAEDTAGALAFIAEAGATFVSRGDESGTHTKELGLWEKAGINPAREGWYQESGQGMGATLGIANEKRGYTLSDRGTYLAQKANYDLDLLLEGDSALFNVYHVIVVNPAKHSKVNAQAARDFAAFIVAASTQAVIRDFGTDEYGEPLFVPEALVEAGSTTPSP
jgi:tungstate transport system substrate-binding protein